MNSQWADSVFSKLLISFATFIFLPKLYQNLNPTLSMNRSKVIKSWINTGNFSDFIQRIYELSESQKSSYVCFANVHMVMEAYKDPLFNEVMDKADLVTPDGRPLSLYMRLFDGIKQARVAGMDVVPALVAEADKRGKSVFFYGSTDDILDKIKERMAKDFPNARLAGTYSPPFRQLTEEEDAEIVKMINDSKPDLLFVALGCPKQEKWMSSHKDRVEACMLGVGQAYLTFTGMEKRLPQWARNLSLEWVYRLVQDPKRLWKRYLVTNSWFLWLVLGNFVKGKIFRQKL
jgi:N-acetylglucosaminyldiphosphoundecaprenol N-acetyl-beta-D-mannosaminyltransferase